MPDAPKPDDADLAALGMALHKDPALRQAALSGMASGINGHLAKAATAVHPSVLAGAAKLKQLRVGGGAVEDNYVVRGISDVVAAVKVRPAGIGEKERAG